jgi:peptide/nickel transport system substrate-binding protein
MGSPQLRSSDVKGKNPFADVRVRKAVNMAINRQAIQRVVMRRQSVPAGAIVPPFVNKELDALPPVDVAGGKALLAESGYPNGFSVTLHCPNDRYLNDEAICQAAVSMLGQVGIRANLVSQCRSDIEARPCPCQFNRSTEHSMVDPTPLQADRFVVIFSHSA